MYRRCFITCNKGGCTWFKTTDNEPRNIRLLRYRRSNTTKRGRSRIVRVIMDMDLPPREVHRVYTNFALTSTMNFKSNFVRLRMYLRDHRIALHNLYPTRQTNRGARVSILRSVLTVRVSIWTIGVIMLFSPGPVSVNVMIVACAIHREKHHAQCNDRSGPAKNLSLAHKPGRQKGASKHDSH